MRKIVISTLILLFATTATTTAVAQEQSKSSLINEIKLDSNYIYGEATMSDEASAQELAFAFLKTNFDIWFLESEIAKEHQKLDSDALAQLAQTLTTPRGGMFRSFIYIYLGDIVLDGVSRTYPQATSVAEENLGSTPSEEMLLSERELFERELVALSNVTTLVDLLSDEKYIDHCIFGEISRESIQQIAIDDAYLIIYNPSDNGVYSILSPRHGDRKNIISGETDSTRNYPESKGVWIIYQ